METGTETLAAVIAGRAERRCYLRLHSNISRSNTSTVCPGLQNLFWFTVPNKIRSEEQCRTSVSHIVRPGMKGGARWKTDVSLSKHLTVIQFVPSNHGNGVHYAKLCLNWELYLIWYGHNLNAPLCTSGAIQLLRNARGWGVHGSVQISVTKVYGAMLLALRVSGCEISRKGFT